MSMNTYPLEEKCAFVIDPVAAATILLSHYADEPGIIGDALHAELQKGRTPYQVASDPTMEGALSDADMFNVSDAYDVLEDADVDPIVHCSEFDGSASTADAFQDHGVMSMSYQDDFAVFVTCSKESGMFGTAYGSPGELLDEYKERLGSLLGADFPYGARIMDVSGTYFC